jgi:phosphoserine aminotransferase
MEDSKTIFNFSAGPCCLPKKVLETARDELLDWHGSGVSVMEMSHRCKEYTKIAEETEKDLRNFMNIPDNYEVLFLQGGASLQFGAIPMNLMKDNKKANYLVTGGWSKNAFKDAQKLGEITEVIKPLKEYTGCPDFSEWNVDKDAEFFHFCENETVYGVEINNFPYEELKDQTLVCDMSSNFCTRPVDFNKYGVVYVGAQKNVGPAGVCIVIVRKDLLDKVMDITPDVMNWGKHAAAGQKAFNTPCVWSIYMCGLNIKHMMEKGIETIEKECLEKSKLMYNCFEASDGYYTNPIQKDFQSRVNITFRVKKDEDLEKKFLSEAEKEGLIQLKGHRSVGGCRASIYNAMPKEGVEALVSFMKKFREENP